MLNPTNTAFYEAEAPAVLPDSSEVAIEAPRYLYLSGDDIGPERKRKNKSLRWGGMELELDYKCFTTTKGRIWRDMFTPMTSGQELFDEQLISDEKKGQAVVTVGSFGVIRTDYATRIHPGEEIRTLLFGKSDLPSKGLVEIKNLRGWEWAKVKEEKIQSFFFPDWEDWKSGKQVKPKELSFSRSLIQKAMASTSDSFLQEIGEDMLLSTENFYAWGVEKLKIETTLVKTPPNPGSQHVYMYSGMAEQLFEILEQQRQDYLKQDFATLANGLQFANSDIQAQFMEQMAMMQKNQDVIVQLLAQQAGVTLPPEVKTAVKTLCAAKKVNGDDCGAPPLQGKSYCTFHREQEPIVEE